jgi:UDP-glucose 4-epimerase
MPVGGCTNPYGWTKLTIEQIMIDSAAAYCMNAVILRYFNPIGAHPSGLIGESPQGIPNNLMPYITQVAVGKREKLYVMGNDYPTRDGTGIRDYLHVVDLAKGHIKALEHTAGHTGSEIFNLGTGKGTSVLDLVEAFMQICGIRLPYVITKRRDGDLAEFWADPGKAESLLGWKAGLTIEDMCRDSYCWQIKNPDGYQ